MQILSNEMELILQLATIVRTLDPDIIIGYEVQNSSWGFLVERALQLGDLIYSTVSI